MCAKFSQRLLNTESGIQFSPRFPKIIEICYKIYGSKQVINLFPCLLLQEPRIQFTFIKTLRIISYFLLFHNVNICLRWICAICHLKYWMTIRRKNKLNFKWMEYSLFTSPGFIIFGMHQTIQSPDKISISRQQKKVRISYVMDSKRTIHFLYFQFFVFVFIHSLKRTFKYWNRKW